MTIQEFKEKFKDDKDALKVVEDLEAKVNNNNYIQDNIALKKQVEDLTQKNELLYNTIMNGAKHKEEENGAPRFKDYSKEIFDVLKNKKQTKKGE